MSARGRVLPRRPPVGGSGFGKDGR